MKFTSEEFMEWLGLKIGDRVEIKDDEDIDNKIFDIKQTKKNIYLVNEKYYFEISFLLDINFNILHAPKRVGDLKCDGNCPSCPCIYVCNEEVNAIDKTLYEVLELGIATFTKMPKKLNGAIYDVIKARLDKEVE